MKLVNAILIAAVSIPLFIAAQGNPQADQKKFEDIKARHDRGETISQEDRQFAMHYMQAAKGKKGGGASQESQEWAKTHPPRDFTGMVPLPDLGKGKYQGEEGGYYPNGQNTPPTEHLRAGLRLAKSIKPLDANGKPSADGRIVLLSIGMSNTTMEFQVFQKLAATDQSLNPRLKIVDGAQGGKTAAVTAKPDVEFWKVVADRLQKADVTPKQVQVAWIKQANARPSEGFPAASKQLEADMVSTLHNLHDKYPNIKIAYLSSRIYGGYALSPLNPEPYAYEGGFAMKWTIADQIAGKPELTYDPAKGAVRSPWVAWGPYLWTDGTKGRKQDDLVWAKDDCVTTDRTHPSDTGREKVSKLILDFLKNDPTSRPWFLRSM